MHVGAQWGINEVTQQGTSAALMYNHVSPSPLYIVIHIRSLVYILSQPLKEYSLELYGCNELKSISSYRKTDTDQYLLSHATC